MILLVEDDPDIREAMLEVLETGGYKGVPAGNGIEALDLLRRGIQPALIICDLSMPEMSGREFRKVQLENAAWAKIPTVFLTATNPDRALVAELKPADFLLKPIEFEAFLTSVARFCPKANG